MCFSPKWTLLLGFSAEFNITPKLLCSFDSCGTTFLYSLFYLSLLPSWTSLPLRDSSLKYSYFYVFSANVILFSNISNWVISSTLMVVILIFMLMTPFIGKYELILKFKALYLVLYMHLLLNVPKTTQPIISKINASFFLMCMLHGPLYSK